MMSYKVAHAIFTDNDSERYDIPEQAVPKA